MALSEEEQRALAQLEADLASDGSAAFTASSVPYPSRPRYALDRRRAGLCTLGLLAGLALVIVGVGTFVGISIAGYLLMLVSALRLRGALTPLDQPESAAQPQHPRLAQQDFVRLMERQWGMRPSDGH